MKNEIFYGDPIALNWKADDGAAATVRVQLSPFGEFTLRDGGRRSGVAIRMIMKCSGNRTVFVSRRKCCNG